MTELKNCKDCPYNKCLFRTNDEFDICPVEKKKQDLIEKDNELKE